MSFFQSRLRWIFLFLILGLALQQLLQCRESVRLAEAEELARENHRRDSLHLLDSLARVEAARPKYREGSIGAGQGIFQVLHDLGVDDPKALELINVLRFQVELVSLHVGEYIAVRWDPADSSRLVEMIYRPNPALEHRLLLDSSNAYLYQEIRKPTQVHHRLVVDSLPEGSTLDAMLARNLVRSSLAQVVNGVLLCKISFRTDARKGDIFRVLLEEEFYKDTLISGSVLFASYEGRIAGKHEAFRYREDDPKSSYNAHYTIKGEALIHSGLRYPVDRLHISSGYGMRRHPVTGGRKLHAGVDYASPTGAPVYAVAPGRVVTSGFDQYSGNKIAVRHADNTTSYYLHLSRRLVGQGAQVRSRQLIGKVGATGRVTGPHLHFAFKDARGRWMNPLQKRMIATPKLQGKRLLRLNIQVDSIRAVLSRVTPDPRPVLPELSDSSELDSLGNSKLDTIARM